MSVIAFQNNAFRGILADNGALLTQTRPDDLKRNQGGFTFGGPAVKNKLFFFAGYQQTWIRSTPGAAFRDPCPSGWLV
jgi:hypothetical protein